MGTVILINICVVVLIGLFLAASGSDGYSGDSKWFFWLCLSLGATFWIWVIYVAAHFLQKFW